MTENIQPTSPKQPDPHQPTPQNLTPSSSSSSFKDLQSEGLSKMFLKMSKGNQKMANEMLNQTLRLASMTIMSQMNQLTQTMRENRPS